MSITENGVFFESRKTMRGKKNNLKVAGDLASFGLFILIFNCLVYGTYPEAMHYKPCCS